MGTIYFIQSDQYYKIGRTEDTEKRLKDLQTSIPYALKIIHSFETNYPGEAEKLLHRIFKNKNIRGEWFNLSITDINFIQSIIGYHNDSFIWGNNPILPLHQLEAIKGNKIYRFDGYNGVVIEITERQILDFAQIVWRRQMNGERALSQKFWCVTHRPRLTYSVYTGIVDLLIQVGVIVNRSPGKQGEMVVSPGEVVPLLQQLIEVG